MRPHWEHRATALQCVNYSDLTAVNVEDLMGCTVIYHCSSWNQGGHTHTHRHTHTLAHTQWWLCLSWCTPVNWRALIQTDQLKLSHVHLRVDVSESVCFGGCGEHRENLRGPQAIIRVFDPSSTWLPRLISSSAWAPVVRNEPRNRTGWLAH